MNLQELKQKLSEVGFSEEVAAKLNEILDQAIAKGGLDTAAKQQMSDLVDLDIEAGVVEAKAMEEMALALSSFADENEKALEMNDEAEAKVEADVDAAVAHLEAAKTPSAAPTL